LFVNAPLPSAVDARFRPTSSNVLNTMYRTVSKTRYLVQYHFVIWKNMRSVETDECLFPVFLSLYSEVRLQWWAIL